MSHLIAELRQATRALARSPGFTIAAVLTLGLGIGANATVFGALRAALLTRPSYPDPERLVTLDFTVSHEGQTDTLSWSYPKFSLMRSSVRSVAPIAAYTTRDLTLADDEGAERLKAEVVTPEYFTLLGVGAVLGRVFGAEAAEPGEGALVAVLSHRLWTGRFAGDVSVLGRSVRLNGHPVTIIGVGPADGKGLTGQTDLWVPMAALPILTWPGALTQPQAHSYQAIGRLVPDATVASARQELTAVGQQVAEAFPVSWGPGSTFAATTVPFLEARINPTGRRAVEVLAVAVALVLLIGCVNLINMLLARATSRRRELAIRSALGASRSHLTRALLVESLVIGLGGGALGLLLAAWGTTALAKAWIAVAGAEGSRGLEFVNADAVTVDVWLALFTLGLALIAGVALGVASAWRATPKPAEVLRAGGNDTGRGLARGWRPSGRGLLVAAQAGLCVVLLAGAGLTLRSVAHLIRSPLGLDTDAVLSLRYRLSMSEISPEQVPAVHTEIVERLAALPGVATAGIDISPPLTGEFDRTVVTRIAGRGPFAEGAALGIGVHPVTPDYFSTMGIPTVRGRMFTSRDAAGAPPVLILSATAAARLFPDEEAVGRRMAIGIDLFGDTDYGEVIAVVGDVNHVSPREPVAMDAYVPLMQYPQDAVTAFLKTDAPPETMLPLVRAAIDGVRPGIPVYDVATMEDRRVAATGRERAIALVLAVFAALAVTLAAIGIYGVVSYSVARRTREVGLRLALGADRGGVLRMIVAEGAGLVAVGGLVGLLVALVAVRVLRNLLYGIGPADPMTFIVTGMVVLSVGLVAAWVPAYRATRVDPMTALRGD